MEPFGPVSVDQVSIGILGLRILVQHLHVRMCRGAVKMKVVLLDILAMVSLGPYVHMISEDATTPSKQKGTCESKKPLFQDIILPVPQREAHANVLMAIADPP